MTNYYGLKAFLKEFTLPAKASFIHRLSVVFLIISFSSKVGAQQAEFICSDTTGCSPLAVNFTNTSDTAGNPNTILYTWDFGDGSLPVTTKDASHTYRNGGVFTVTLTMTDNFSSFTSTATQDIYVNKTVAPNLSVNTDVCAQEWLSFAYNNIPLDSVFWDFGDGNTSKETHNPMTHRYLMNDFYTLSLTTYFQGCDSTETYTVNVNGPTAEYMITPDSACIGETVTFTVSDTNDVVRFRWDTREASGISDWNENPYKYAYKENTRIQEVKLELQGNTKNCTLIDTVYIYPVIAGISYGTPLCAINPIFFVDGSEGQQLTYFWNFGDNTTSTEKSTFHSYASEGEYIITHAIENPRGCQDTIVDTIYAYTPPTIQIADTAFNTCRGDSVQLEVEGGDNIAWSPQFGLSDPGSYTPKAAPPITTKYNVSVKDTLTECATTKQITVFVQQEPDWNSISVYPTDTNIIIGDPVLIKVNTGSADSSSYVYEWSPDYQVSTCINCVNFGVLPLESIIYTLLVSDTNLCFSNEYESNIEVREEYKIGVAAAFTPNGDGINDLIFVNGWGIKRIIEFRIYNRWGKEVFFSDDASIAWDGTVDGSPASIDTYAYVVKAEMWNGETIVKNGTFNLIR